MSANDESCCESTAPVCCPCGGDLPDEGGITRRGFMGGGAAALGGAALTGLSWSALAAVEDKPLAPPARRALVVKPVFVYSTPRRRAKSSWRNWGGIQTQDEADKEAARIADELAKLKARVVEKKG